MYAGLSFGPALAFVDSVEGREPLSVVNVNVVDIVAASTDSALSTQSRSLGPGRGHREAGARGPRPELPSERDPRGGAHRGEPRLLSRRYARPA